MTIQDRVNNNLRTLFDVNGDPIYREFICDKDGNNPDVVTLPTDIDIGIITSQIEYLRRLSISLMKQIYVDQAVGEFLEFQLEEFFGSLRAGSEIDAAWVQRTIDLVFNQKVSRASIIFVLRPYSSIEPEVTTVVSDESAFADFSYADVYVKATVVVGGSNVYILPALAEDFDSSFFTFKVELWDTDTADIFAITDLLNKIIASGVSYILQINYS
jgi:hypothetical protein